MMQPGSPVGPWIVQRLETGRHGYADWPTFAVRDARTNVCLAVVGEVDRYTSSANEAHARLMAAAPTMLETLAAIVARTQAQGRTAVEALDEIHRLARAAVRGASDIAGEVRS